MRVLTLGGVVVSLIAGALGVLLTLKPELKPCLGDTDASFVAAPVFPRSSYVSYLIRGGTERADAIGVGEQAGALVAASYRVSGFRGKPLALTVSLLTVTADGALGPVIARQDRQLDTKFTPTDCSQAGGRDLWIPRPSGSPAARARRYRAVIELYRDPGELTERIALTQTAVFRF